MQYRQCVPETKPTHTSYAVLGLLALRSWTTYELARQSERSLGWFFPRAERAVYQEAKRLVALGWARAKKTATGRRISTVYRITPVGREALRGWLAEPSEPTHIESEAALKVFFADQAGTTELRATITGMRHDAASALERLGAMAAGEHEFPERTAMNVLSMRLVTDLHETLYRWAEWADTAVNVLEKADRRAIQRQTQDVLHAISASRAGLR
jgi:PadR family transcriptional regulator, regulatory protein AphA